MRWLVNENVSATVIRALRERGHDILSVKESLRGTGDPHILALAHDDKGGVAVELIDGHDFTGTGHSS